MESAALPLIDLPRLLDRCAGDGSFVAELLTLFAETSPALLVRLRDAAEAARPDLAATAIHSLKGSALNMSAAALAEHLIRAEAALRSGQPIDVEAVAHLLGRTLIAAEACGRELRAAA